MSRDGVFEGAKRSQATIDAANAERTGRPSRQADPAPTGWLFALAVLATLCWLVALLAGLDDGVNWGAAVCAVLFGVQTVLYGVRWRRDRRSGGDHRDGDQA